MFKIPTIRIVFYTNKDGKTIIDLSLNDCQRS